MKKLKTLNGFTLIELLVVIGIIALLASIAVPAFTGVQIKAAQTKAMSNAKQIGLACKQYAIDNNGAYPSYITTSGSTGTQVVNDANAAFDNLLPSYLTTIQPFYLAKSPFTPGNPQPDPQQTTMAASVSGIQNVDYAQATTQLSAQELALQAAQESYASIAKLSLFTYVQ